MARITGKATTVHGIQQNCCELLRTLTVMSVEEGIYVIYK